MIVSHVRILGQTWESLLYSKTGVCRGIPIFLIFTPKHRLWVLVRTASARRFKCVPTTYVLSKNKKNITNFLLNIFNFTTTYLGSNVNILDSRYFCNEKKQKKKKKKKKKKTDKIKKLVKYDHYFNETFIQTTNIGHSKTQKVVKILNVNCRSVVNKKAEFFSLLNCHNPDIVNLG